VALNRKVLTEEIGIFSVIGWYLARRKYKFDILVLANVVKGFNFGPGFSVVLRCSKIETSKIVKRLNVQHNVL
jgi:hypothetical protein